MKGAIRDSFGGRSGVVCGRSRSFGDRSGSIQGSFGVRSEVVRQSFGVHSKIFPNFSRNFSIFFSPKNPKNSTTVTTFL